MKRRYFLLILTISFILTQCAKKGRPSGGPKDEDAPIFVVADPPYETVNFDKREIKLYFDEYIKLKDLNKQLIVSPPLKPENPSLITPQGSPSQFITIKLIDTLQKNTTYIFDFGNSVEDNNESNKLERFKYVFSTGNYIDSLTLKGKVKNSFSSENIKDIKLLLYRLDTSYTDSAVYNVKPNYVTSSLDTSLFEFTNLREGKYFLMALKDKSSDYLFDPKEDEIGFLSDTITLPQDSIIDNSVSLFKEILPYKFKRGKEDRKGKLIFGYEGNPDGVKIDILSEVPKDFKTVSFFQKESDTISLYHSPIDRDSLIFTLTNGAVIDTSIVKLKKKKLDSLVVSTNTRSYLEFKDTMFLDTNNPIVEIDTSKVKFFDKDTLNVPYQIFISAVQSRVGFLFEKKLKYNYQIDILPEALTDIFNQTNDTLQYKFRTRKLEDYGDITLNVLNPSSRSVIVQLIDLQDKIVGQEILKESGTISFLYLLPKKYKIRIIYDDNNNEIWDTGDFLNKFQPEYLEYYPVIQEVRPNWSLNENITIKRSK